MKMSTAAFCVAASVACFSATAHATVTDLLQHFVNRGFSAQSETDQWTIRYGAPNGTLLAFVAA